jgi:hypothetical protein
VRVGNVATRLVIPQFIGGSTNPQKNQQVTLRFRDSVQQANLIVLTQELSKGFAVCGVCLYVCVCMYVCVRLCMNVG